jgi:hypothetical protein
MVMNKDVQDQVKMYQANDYDIHEENLHYVVMRKNTASALGHLVVFIIFGWWTLGLANLIYWLASSKTKKIMK